MCLLKHGSFFFTENRNEILAIVAGVFSVVLLVVLLLLGGSVRRQRKRKLSSLDNRLLFGETNPDNPYNQIERAMLTAYVSPNVSVQLYDVLDGKPALLTITSNSLILSLYSNIPITRNLLSKFLHYTNRFLLLFKCGFQKFIQKM